MKEYMNKEQDKTDKKIEEIKSRLNELGSNGDYEEYNEFLLNVVHRVLVIYADKEMPSFMKDDCLNELQMEFEEDFAKLFVVMADKLGYIPNTEVQKAVEEAVRKMAINIEYKKGKHEHKWVYDTKVTVDDMAERAVILFYHCTECGEVKQEYNAI